MSTPPDSVLAELRRLGSAENRAGMARFGINPARALGVSVTALRKLARPLAPDHALALALWDSAIHEARILATMLADPARMDDATIEAWVGDLDSWDVCDQACANLLWRTSGARERALAWCAREPEFEKRAGFALMAALAWKDKAAPDAVYQPLFAAIERGAADQRNFVKKAVNWALRQIGKRSPALRAQALACAERLLAQDGKAAKWIARDAIRELRAR